MVETKEKLKMKIEINIEKCNDCFHLDHSGAFTPGGSKPICGHNEACGTVRAKTHKSEPYHWIHRVVRRDKTSKLQIPEWCPLKNGESY